MKMISILRSPDFVAVHKNQEVVALERSGENFGDGAYQVAFKADGTLLLRAEKPVSYVVLRWRAEFPDSTLFFGDALERIYGDCKWQHVVPERIMYWYFLANVGDSTKGFGVKVRPNAIASWQVDATGITLWLDVNCGGLPVELSEELELATLVELASDEGENAFRLHRRFCRAMCGDGLIPTSPVYGSNNWYYAYGRSSNRQILDDTELLASLTRNLDNRPFMVIDDGWQETAMYESCNGGPYDRGNYLFPDMKSLAESMKARSVRPGIWIRPTLTSDRFLKADWRLARNPNVLDITNPEVSGYIGRQVLNITKNWGYELVKFDFSTFDFLGKYGWQNCFRLTEGNWRFFDKSMTTAQAFKRLYKTILENANGSILIGCNCIGHLGAGYFHLHRSGDDTSGIQWERTRKMGINALAFRMAQHNIFFSIDADCVGVTKNIDWALNKQWLELVSKSGTPLFCSMAPDDLSQEMKDDLAAAFKINAELRPVAEPVNWLYTTCPDKWRIDGKVYKFQFDEKFGAARFDAVGNVIT